MYIYTRFDEHVFRYIQYNKVFFSEIEITMINNIILINANNLVIITQYNIFH